MEIQTYSVIVGNENCNAKCPYCISQMTPNLGLGYKKPKVNWRNFEIGCKYAKNKDVDTVLLTGKGEPTIYPQEISDVLDHVKKYEFPFIELQTNGLVFRNNKKTYETYLKEWYNNGMTTIALSVAHFKNEKNKEIFTPQGEYPNLEKTINGLHEIGYSVRLSVTMAQGYIESTSDLEDLVDYAKENNVEQITVRRAEKPDESRNPHVAAWVEEHYIADEKIEEMRQFLDEHGTRLRELVHGAIVYDYKGQNICLNNCLTMDASKDEIRQLIFFPDGHLRYDWQHKGAVII